MRQDDCFYTSGDVQVHPSAAIAPGVFLQADSGSRLVIGPNVSIGSGALLHAQGGVLSLATRVTLGTGVLVMGKGRIGAGACIGANTTLLFTIAVEPGQLIEAGTVVGEAQEFGQQGAAQQLLVEETLVEETVFGETTSQADAPPAPRPDASSAENTPSGTASSDPTQPGSTQPSLTQPRPTQVYGRVVVERLMRMMSSGQPPNGSQP